MKKKLNYKPLVIGTASSALFNLSADNEIFDKKGLEKYEERQIRKENERLEPGDGFPLIKKFLAIDELLRKKYDLEDPVIEVILLSQNTSNTGLRVFNSIEKHGLNIKRAAFCGGKSPHLYARDFGCHLFLSRDQKVVKEFIDNGLAAATIQKQKRKEDKVGAQHIKIAFDGDSVLFSNESERVHQEEGLTAFSKNEKNKARVPLIPGPFAPFLERLSFIQQKFYTVEDRKQNNCHIRTALVTARSAPTHKRVILTLRKWRIHLDECLFIGKDPKGKFLKSFEADIFFDDQWAHCSSAQQEGITSAYVPNNPRLSAKISSPSRKRRSGFKD